ncbi:hypothetical protein EXIGLDRAFT_731208 [Exidia glandulosa HHB12029]|uniref:Uncharacterized protein n=1 Tax=Exidia glandulosa HHB12029 TaxID=1314781 RepID=A0A165BYW4_EXIGL|nr:hypothetical protein EXIGLDRAFT_731208 [Exidia glandulosa HHB12029]
MFIAGGSVLLFVFAVGVWAVALLAGSLAFQLPRCYDPTPVYVFIYRGDGGGGRAKVYEGYNMDLPPPGGRVQRSCHSSLS